MNFIDCSNSSACRNSPIIAWPAWQGEPQRYAPYRTVAEIHIHLTDLRHPAASASSGVQNHRLPPPLSILILA